MPDCLAAGQPLSLDAPLPALPFTLLKSDMTWVGIEGVSPKPEQEVVWLVAWYHHSRRVRRISDFTEFYDSIEVRSLDDNMPPPANPGVKWCHLGMDYRSLRKKTP